MFLSSVSPLYLPLSCLIKHLHKGLVQKKKTNKTNVDVIKVNPHILQQYIFSSSKDYTTNCILTVL